MEKLSVFTKKIIANIIDVTIILTVLLCIMTLGRSFYKYTHPSYNTIQTLLFCRTVALIFLPIIYHIICIFFLSTTLGGIVAKIKLMDRKTSNSPRKLQIFAKVLSLYFFVYIIMVILFVIGLRIISSANTFDGLAFALYLPIYLAPVVETGSLFLSYSSQTFSDRISGLLEKSK